MTSVLGRTVALVAVLLAAMMAMLLILGVVRTTHFASSQPPTIPLPPVLGQHLSCVPVRSVGFIVRAIYGEIVREPLMVDSGICDQSCDREWNSLIREIEGSELASIGSDELSQMPWIELIFSGGKESLELHFGLDDSGRLIVQYPLRDQVGCYIVKNREEGTQCLKRLVECGHGTWVEPLTVIPWGESAPNGD